MKFYTKRIGFIISYQTLVPHGGIGQFAHSFIKLMSDNNIKVDIITDKKPADSDFVNSFIESGIQIIYPDSSLIYKDHSNIFQFGDSYCYERMANFRNAIIKALTNNMYDMFVCNTYESIQVASTLNLEDVIQIVAYTHLESQIFKDTKNPFVHNVNVMMRKQLEVEGLTVGTQSEFNKNHLDNAVHLPIPLSEADLLDAYKGKRSGVLFVGRWEKQKNPDVFVDLIKKTNLPARVMTSAKSAIKFKQAFEKEKIKDFEIVSGLLGKEKVDFIKKSRVAFNPSTVESYGLAFLEQMIQLPTVALDNMRWTSNFDSRFFFTCRKSTMPKVIQDLYEKFPTGEDYLKTGALNFYKQQEAKVFVKWKECIYNFESKQSNRDNATICKHKNVSVYDYYKNILNREQICIDDVRSILTNRQKFQFIYTDTNTYITTDPNWIPEEETESLFIF